ncbi:MAG: flavoprotein, partial [Terriglobales bacterium]
MACLRGLPARRRFFCVPDWNKTKSGHTPLNSRYSALVRNPSEVRHMDAKRVIVGITGATGTIYGVRMLELLRAAGIETHLVVSNAGEMTRAYETNLS